MRKNKQKSQKQLSSFSCCSSFSLRLCVKFKNVSSAWQSQQNGAFLAVNDALDFSQEFLVSFVIMKKQLNVSRLAATLALVPLASAPFLAATPAQAQTLTPSAATVSVNGSPIAFPDQPPVNAGGRLLVPLRAIFEALGATVNYSNGTIRANRGSTNLELALGSDQAIINGQRSTLDVPAQAVFGRTLVPLRFVGEAFGATVNYNPVTQAVAITATPATGTNSPPPTNANVPAYNVPGGTTVAGSLINVNTAGNTITINENGQTRIYPLAGGVIALSNISIAQTPGATPLRQPARGIGLNSLNNGDDVRLNLDATGRVTQIITAATVVVARVQFAGGNTIVLDDDRDTTLTLGPNLSFVDAQGRAATTANLQPGSSVALFLSREGRQVYRVSAYAPDYTPGSATTGAPDPLPSGGLPGNNAPQIQLVSHNAAGPLKAGSRLDVAVRATTGQRLSFSLGARIQNVPLYESTTQPGVYNGSYTVKAGDDVLDARVLARLSANNGFEDTAQSVEPVTIDTVAPRVFGTFPANGATVNVNQPNIVVFADDLGGSGLGGATMEITNGNQRFPVQATVAPPTSINAVVPQPLSGLVNVRAVISDKAGNAATSNFAFTVAGTQTGGIQSFSQGATRPLNTGETVPLILTANPAGQASFDVVDEANRVVASNLPLTEDRNRPGEYRADFRVPDNARGNLRFIGRFSPGDGTSTTAPAAAPVSVLVPANLTVASPRNGATVNSPLVVSGKGAPGSTVNVSVVATGTQLFILEYNEDLGTRQVRVDNNGNWQTEAIQLPARKNVSNLSYVISATQTDGANATGEPVTLTVKGR